MAKKELAEVLSIDGREVRITNPDKPYFSRDVKLSKLDVVQYYLRREWSGRRYPRPADHAQALRQRRRA